MMDGFINILKPTGMTSHDVVSIVRRLLHQKKVEEGAKKSEKVVPVKSMPSNFTPEKC